MTGYYKWDRTVRPSVPHFILAEDGQVLGAAGRWEQERAEEPSSESFVLLTHPNSAIPKPLTLNGPVFISGLVERACSRQG